MRETIFSTKEEKCKKNIIFFEDAIEMNFHQETSIYTWLNHSWSFYDKRKKERKKLVTNFGPKSDLREYWCLNILSWVSLERLQNERRKENP